LRQCFNIEGKIFGILCDTREQKMILFWDRIRNLERMSVNGNIDSITASIGMRDNALHFDSLINNYSKW
jgi:hypothetical protein